MTWLYWLFILAVLEEMASLFNVIRNYRYARSKRKSEAPVFLHKAALIVPCKGVDPGFRDNIASLYAQVYDHYRLWFVVSDESDPAYGELHRLQRELGPFSKAREVRVLVAGLPHGCSQKLHNLVFCCRQMPDDVEVLAFADSDIRVQPDWLARLVWPLRADRVGAATGYRWLVPDRNNLASLALSAINGKVAQMMGNTRWNLTWGGSMAIRTDIFRRLGIEAIWAQSLSDDLTLGKAVKRAHLKVVFVPACIVPSPHSATWRSLWEFGRRQFIITRWYCPGTWWLALLGALLSVIEPLMAVALTWWALACRPTITLWNRPLPAWQFWIAVTVILLVSGFVKAVFRQRMTYDVLGDQASGLRGARHADLAAFWAWSVLTLALILSSAFGRTIRWRGIRYRVSSPTHVQVLPDPKA
jgi:ceramide glucosyltransferase